LANGSFEKGKHTIEWNGLDKNQKEVVLGVYFYQLEAEKDKVSKKIILLK